MNFFDILTPFYVVITVGGILILTISIVSSRSRRKEKSIAILILVLIYMTMAAIETKNISSETLDEAFDELLLMENLNEEDITSKVVTKIDDIDVILFEIDNRNAVALLREGFFGWQLASYQIGSNTESIYQPLNLLISWIPDEVLDQTERVLVNGEEAKVIELNSKSKVWMLNNAETNFNTMHLNVRYIDKNENEIINK